MCFITSIPSVRRVILKSQLKREAMFASFISIVGWVKILVLLP